jgi:hypothetical protein
MDMERRSRTILPASLQPQTARPQLQEPESGRRNEGEHRPLGMIFQISLLGLQCLLGF